MGETNLLVQLLKFLSESFGLAEAIVILCLGYFNWRQSKRITVLETAQLTSVQLSSETNSSFTEKYIEMNDKYAELLGKNVMTIEKLSAAVNAINQTLQSMRKEALKEEDSDAGPGPGPGGFI